MSFFNLFQKKSADDHWKMYARKMSSVAQDYAGDFHKTLDYSEKSIMELEEILDWYSNDIAVSKPTDNQIWSMATIFGSYLGETLLKNGLSEKGFSWGTEGSSNIPLLRKQDGTYLTPNDKVYKRLVKGREDSVVSFYRFATTQI
ncbi:MAG: hypothetical protein IKU56_02145 [Clostridia bacterium]|nr:hypothetical protein [Clostridia bacterium]